MRKGNNNIVNSLLRSSSGGSHVMWQFVGHGFPDNNERTKSPDLWIHAPCSMLHAHPVTIGNFKWGGGKKLSLKIRILKGKFDPKPEVSVVRGREFKSFVEEYQYESFLE